MRDYCKRKKNRRKDTISPDVVEETRLKFGLNKSEMSILMGITIQQYRLCEKKGGFIAFRYYAATDAISNSVMRNAFNQIKAIDDFKNKNNVNLDDDSLIDDNDVQ